MPYPPPTKKKLSISEDKDSYSVGLREDTGFSQVYSMQEWFAGISFKLVQERFQSQFIKESNRGQHWWICHVISKGSEYFLFAVKLPLYQSNCTLQQESRSSRPFNNDKMKVFSGAVNLP